MKHKPLARQLTAQFFRGNLPMFALAVFAALTGGTLNLIVTWLMQQLIDAASGLPGALPLGQLAWITGGFILLCAALMLLKYASEPRFIEKAMRQYKDFAFQKLTEKSISSFRAESTAAYLSALTNDAASIEADDLSQLLSVITKAVTFFGALAMMLWYSLLMTAIAAGVTVLPLIASLLTGGQLQAAEKRVSDQNRDFTAALSDCLGGFSVVKTFRAEKEIFRLFAESNRALEQEKFSRRRLKALVGMIGATTGIIAQLGVFLAGAYLALLRWNGDLTCDLYIPFWNVSFEINWIVYLVFAMFVIVGCVNAVNLTDGIDGLASGVTLPVMVFFAVTACMWGKTTLALLPAALAGGLAGFLIYNFHPAKVFMGDTGSLFLGGMVCGLAFALDMPLVLILVGIIYIIETVSVIMQVTYFKLTHGKRIFRMTPIHHHFEMGGWSEVKIFTVFTGITVVMCILAFLGVRAR